MNFAAAKIQIRSIFTLANNSSRVSNLCGRKADKVYGIEEGHGPKNEVRKERWIKAQWLKKHGHYINGEDYRVKNGYMRYQRDFMVDAYNNWSDVDSGLPGASTDLQRIRKLKNLRLAQDIFDAAMLVQRAKDIK